MAASCLGALMTVAGPGAEKEKEGFTKSQPGLRASGLLLQLLQMESAYALTTLTLTWGGIIILCMGLAATTGLIQRLDWQTELRRILAGHWHSGGHH